MTLQIIGKFLPSRGDPL